MIIGKAMYSYKFTIWTNTIEISDKLKILGVNLDDDLYFKPQIHAMVKKAYAKIRA